MKYIGTSQNGINGPIQIEIAVENNKIAQISILSEAETPDIGGVALEALVKEAIEKQSAQLDVVAGATVTSDAFMEALSTAMEKAGL